MITLEFGKGTAETSGAKWNGKPESRLWQIALKQDVPSQKDGRYLFFNA
jgi:hypothetical protein